MYAAPVRSLAALLACAALVSCRSAADPDPGAGADASAEPAEDAASDDRPDSAFDPPDDDLVEPVGSAATLDIATWNIENFPIEVGTVALAANLISSLDLDLVAVQEIGDRAAFEELIERLRADAPYAGILSSHTYGSGEYQKVGFIYREDVVELSGGILLFEDKGYEFPRPPLQVIVTVKGSAEPLSFVAITAHLKAGLGDEDRRRRAESIELLDQYLRDMVDGGLDDEVVLLGDLNETVDDLDGAAVMQPFLGDPLYDVRTEPLAEAGTYTFVPSGVMLDHIVTTSALAAELSGGQVVVPELDRELGGYVEAVSDHLPVVVTMPVF